LVCELFDTSIRTSKLTRYTPVVGAVENGYTPAVLDPLAPPFFKIYELVFLLTVALSDAAVIEPLIDVHLPTVPPSKSSLYSVVAAPADNGTATKAVAATAMAANPLVNFFKFHIKFFPLFLPGAALSLSFAAP